MPGHGIAPAERHIDLPGFWPAYFGYLWDAFAHEPELFGADLADVDAAAEALYEATEVWPAYRIPLPSGAVLWIVHRNLPDDAGTDYLLTHPDRARETCLASIDGHFTGPGLSWTDLVAVADSAPAGAEGVRDPDRRLLLLLPAFGDAEAPAEEAMVRTAAALTAVGVPEEAAPGAAERLLDHPFWDGPVWSAPGDSPLSGGTGEERPLRQALRGCGASPLSPSTGRR